MLAVGGIVAVVAAMASTRRASATRPVVVSPTLTASERREIEITFYSERAARDTMSAADRARLALLYLDRARESGNFADLQRAEAAARASVRLRESHNASAFGLLASALMSQHRFREALVAAERAEAIEPGVASQRALIGEIALELGDYDRARVVFDSLRREPLSDIASLRLARWYEISGRPDLAEGRLNAVLSDWKKLPEPAPANVAWIHARLADLALKGGRLVFADSVLAVGLKVAPADHRLLSAAARLAARQERWDSAIAIGERAIAVTMDPLTLGVLSDAWASRGDGAKAAQYAGGMRSVAFADTAGFPHRAWSLWMLDHDRDIPEVLRLARAELRVRKDVYGYDLYAWALHKSGRAREAREAMDQALRMGTRDELLSRHAAAIMGPAR